MTNDKKTVRVNIRYCIHYVSKVTKKCITFSLEKDGLQIKISRGTGEDKEGIFYFSDEELAEMAAAWEVVNGKKSKKVKS